jgi:isoleucyl-tRNA synthetase
MEILDQAADIVEQGGIEAWSRVTPEDILGATDAAHYTKSTDILEVWFDSGSTFWHVLRGTHAGMPTQRQRPRGRPVPRRPRPAPRLVPQLAAAGLRLFGRAPYRGLLTHGFTDGQGRKMSKSLGNTVEPQSVTASWAPRSSACGWPPPTTRAT